jgi:tRNA G37 N-methylase TrmD
MKLIIAVLSFALPLLATAAEYESTLLVQTGKLRESDMIVRTITDLESNKICLTFYVRTVGTSPAMTCYDAISGFRSSVNQVGFFKEGELVVRKVKDFQNSVSCLVAYVSTPGTSPAIDCYKSAKPSDDAIVRAGHLHEGDLDVQRLADPDSTKTCLIAYVATGGTAPSLTCYNSLVQPGEGGIVQTSELREGDLLVRKIVDQPNQKTCLITYVSTRGTSPYFYCFDEHSQKGPPIPPRP